jgi:hypothetical protein
MSKHQEQFDRMMRYYARFKALNDGLEMTQTSENYVDDVYAFFINCFHLKDWILNDPACNKSNQVESHVGNNQILNLCRDICHATKHLVLHTTATGDTPKYGRRHLKMEMRDDLSGKEHPQKTSIKIKIDHNGQELDAFDIATQAVNAWQAFLT